MKTYKFTFKDSRLFFNNVFEVIVKTRNLTAEELFKKYMMIKCKEAYMDGMIKLLNIKELA